MISLPTGKDYEQTKLDGWRKRVIDARDVEGLHYEAWRGYQLALADTHVACGTTSALWFMAEALWNPFVSREHEERPLLARSYLQALRWLREVHG